MADTYLSISQIANDTNMKERVKACLSQQVFLGHIPDTFFSGIPSVSTRSAVVMLWVEQNRYIWASSPTWGEKWTAALLAHAADPEYEPGTDLTVIADTDILTTIRSLARR